MLGERCSRELDAGLGALHSAVAVASGIQREMSREGIVKPDRTPVTIADLAVQAIVIHRIAAHFPHDPIVAEEDSTPLRTGEGGAVQSCVTDWVQRWIPDFDSARVCDAIDRGKSAPADRFWTLDPIDGTKGFLTGAHYAIALALIVKGRVEMAMLACPKLSLGAAMRGVIALAVRGEGACGMPLTGREPRSIRVSDTGDPSLARLIRSRDPGHIDTTRLDRFIACFGSTSDPIAMDSQAKHAAIASAQADVMLRLPATSGFKEFIWDQAAGALVIEEAGGRVTDLNGSRLDFSAGRRLSRNDGVVASNRRLHDAVLDAVQRSL